MIVNNLANSVERRNFAAEQSEVAFFTLSALALPVNLDFVGKVTAKFKEKQVYREYLTTFNAVETILDRLKHFAATLDMSIYQFENECDITHGVANKMRETSRPLLWEKIRHRFPILNIEWLKTGEGEMLLPEHPAIVNDGISVKGDVSHSAVNNGSGSASYHSTGDQQLLRTLINKVEGLSAQIAEKDAQISRLLEIVERFAGIASRFYAGNENPETK